MSMKKIVISFLCIFISFKSFSNEMLGKGLFCYKLENNKKSNVIGLWFIDKNSYEEHTPYSAHENFKYENNFYINSKKFEQIPYSVNDEKINLYSGKIDRYKGVYTNDRDKTLLDCNLVTSRDFLLEQVWEIVEKKRKSFEIKQNLYKEKLKKRKF